MNPSLAFALQAAAYIVVTLLVLLLAKVASDMTFRGPKPGSDNLAFGFRRAGLYLATAYAMTAAFSITPSTFWAGVGELLKDGVIITVCLLFAQFINDKLIVTRLDNDQAIADDNLAVGLTEFGSYIATGMIAYSSFTGGTEGQLWRIAITFFALGQLALVVSFWLQEILLPGSFIDEVRHGNMAAGILVGGTLIALGIILQASIAGPFTGWGPSLKAFGQFTLAGLAVLLVSQWVFLKFFLKGKLTREVQHECIPISLVATSGQIAIAMIIYSLAV